MTRQTQSIKEGSECCLYHQRIESCGNRLPSSAGACCSTGISSHAFSVRLSRGGAITPGIASLNPGLMSEQPFRAAGLHAGGVKEFSPR